MLHAFRSKFLLALALLPLFCTSAEGAKTPGRPAAPASLRNWGLDNSEFASHIEAKRAWKLTEGSNKIIVAVIDTGIDGSHAGLKGNLWHKAGTDEYGYDFVLNRKNPTDINGHGSHIAGIIGAVKNPRLGIAGVSPRVSIMPIRYNAGDDKPDNNLMSNIVKGIDYALENGAKIINISTEGVGFSIAEFRAIERASRKGVLVVVAAGNKAQNNDTCDSPSYPSSYNLPNILAVAATNIHNDLWASSNWGPVHVHVAAPGEDIYSTVPRGYGYLSGTSQATAFVSGVAALMLSENPGLSPVELKRMIMSSVDKSAKLKDKVASGGRLNAFKALSLAMKIKDGNAPNRVVANTITRRLRLLKTKKRQ